MNTKWEAEQVVAVDVFDEIRARHEGRILRLRNMPEPAPRPTPTRHWHEWRKRRHDRDARRYHQCMLAGWWEAETEIIFRDGYWREPKDDE